MLTKWEEFAHLGLDVDAGIALFAISLVFLFSTLTWSQEHDMASMPGMNMSSPAASEGPAQAAKHLADKKESDFNHRLAGLFVIVAGIFILSESSLAKRWPVMRYAWPMCFLAVGIFLQIGRAH